MDLVQTNSLHFVKFDHGQRKIAGSISHHNLRIVPPNWTNSALGYALVGGCAEPEQGHQIIWVTGNFLCACV